MRVDANADDDWRLRAVVPTIEKVARYAKKTIVIAHRGRPNPARFDKRYSLERDASVLAGLLTPEVWFITDRNLKAVERELAKVPDGSVVLLENIRGFKGEEPESKQFAKALAKLGDYFVNDAFPVNHHPASSITLLPSYLPSFVGLQLEREIRELGRATTNATKHPSVVVIGGAKAKDKLGVLARAVKHADYVLVGGACANALLYLRGVKVGQSVFERDPKLLATLKPYVNHPRVILPVDWKVSNGKILDIGPKTIKLFSTHLAKARSILWTGPLGLIEDRRFRDGSLAVARAVAKNKKAYSVTGGGETVTFLKTHKLDQKFSFVSTGGGAMISFVSGDALPGITALGTPQKKRKVKQTRSKQVAAFKEAIAHKKAPPKLSPVYDLFYHDDFDGRASAAIFVHFLESRGSRIERFIPVNHNLWRLWSQSNGLELAAREVLRIQSRTIGDEREQAKLAALAEDRRWKLNPAIVVDFPYQPKAAVWVDHHETGIQKESWKKSFKETPWHRLDPRFPSGAGLVLDQLVRVHGYVPPKHIKELAYWADIIDGARYTSAYQTIALREPALQLNRFMSSSGQAFEPLEWLVRLMAAKELAAVARLPEVRKAVEGLREAQKASLVFYRRNLKVDGVAGFINVSALEGPKLRFAPYYLKPDLMYCMTLKYQHAAGVFTLSVGVNPWKKRYSQFHIGEIMKERFGGGGHPAAGAAVFQTEADALQAAAFITSLFNNAG